VRVLIAGASGFVGSALVDRLSAAGHDVVRLVRRGPESADEIAWSPAHGVIDADRTGGDVMDRVDAVINLSGASLAKLPWSKRYREEILRSRLDATRTLVEAMRAAERPPAVFLSASAVGVYGDRPGEVLTEQSAPGTGFLAGVVEQWEGQALLAPDTTRTVLLRSGIVVGDGGALARVQLLAKLGVAGPLGTGRQHWPWIARDDEARAIVHLLDSELEGPVNLAGPQPATAGELVRELAHRLGRPYWAPVPAFALRLVLGVAADELLLADQQVRPQRLLDDGFRFEHADAASAIDAMLADERRG
jgi:uncharacterized protein (TIGR01777 family)